MKTAKQVKLNDAHLLRMVDDTGIYQHALHSLPNPKEGYTTDDNARLMMAGALGWEATGEEKYLDMAYRGLDFLLEQTTRDGFFWPIGCHGWSQRGGEPALYDQQPVEACATILVCLRAHKITGDPGLPRQGRALPRVVPRAKLRLGGDDRPGERRLLRRPGRGRPQPEPGLREPAHLVCFHPGPATARAARSVERMSCL